MSHLELRKSNFHSHKLSLRKLWTRAEVCVMSLILTLQDITQSTPVCGLLQ